MASSSTRKQMNMVLNEMNSLLGGQAQAPEFFRQGIDKALGENIPLLKEGQAQAERSYTLPGQLMDQYQKDYGNTFGGASGLARMNSVLGRIGSQFSLVDYIANLLKQRQATAQDIAANLTNQYGLMTDAAKQKFGALQGIWQTELQAEDAARARASAARQAADWANLQKLLANRPVNTSPAPVKTAPAKQPFTAGPIPSIFSKPLDPNGLLGSFMKTGITTRKTTPTMKLGQLTSQYR